MPLLKYREYKARPDAMAVVQRARSYLENYARQGYTLTLRQLYYRFIADDIFPNTEKSYARLGDIVARARDAGMLDWDHLEDRGRSLDSNPHWNDPKSFLNSVCPQFAIDLWLDQPKRVEVWVEKDALSQVIGHAAEEYDVPYLACKGYTSQSAMWEAGHKRFRKYGLAGQDVVVIHLGDHDPSGIDMTRDIEDRLRRYAALTNTDCEQYPDAARETDPAKPHWVNIEVRRIALNMDQIDTYNPPPNPAKVTDSRFAEYQVNYGEESWELDALDPATLHELIQDNIREVMDESLYEARFELQRRQREQLMSLSNSWGGIVEFLGLEE